MAVLHALNSLVLIMEIIMEEFSLDTPRNRLWSYHLSGSTSSCHDGSMLSKGGAVEKPSLNTSPTHHVHNPGLQVYFMSL